MAVPKKIVIHFEVEVKQLVYTVLLLLALVYIGWEYYWYKTVGLAFIKWHTHLVATSVAIGIVILLPAWLLLKFTSNDSKRKNILLSVFSVWVTFLMLELIFCFTDWNKTYSEKRWGYYQSPFDPDPDNSYHIYSAGDIDVLESSEFSYASVINSLGFRGDEWQKERKAPIRIITLGDSFTEGDGAPQDSSYPVLLQKILGDSIEVLNAGVCGSDPVFGLKNLEDRLLVYKPDIVLQAVSENDVLFDFCIRGGIERFQQNNKVKFNSPPWWETIYAISYSSRTVLHLFNFNMNTPCGDDTDRDLINERNQLLKEVYKRFNALAAKNNIKIIMVFYPTKFEVFRDKYYFPFEESRQFIDSLEYIEAVDLFPIYRKRIKESGLKPEDYYWIIDGHHNSKGYLLMAHSVAEAISVQK